MPCRLAEELFQLSLTIRSIGPHVTEVPLVPQVGLSPTVTIRIERAIERDRAPGAEPVLQLAQRRTAGEAEVHVEVRNLISAEILGIPSAKLGNGDRSVDIVKGFHATPGIQHCVDSFDPVREK